MLERIRKLVARGYGNQWFNDGTVEVYIRVGTAHATEEGVLRCIDIGNVNVNPEQQNKGNFTKLLEQIEELAKGTEFNTVYVENVLTDQFANFFRKRGYTELKDKSNLGVKWPSSYYKKL